MDAGVEFLTDPLKQLLRARALDLQRNSGIGRLESLAELFPGRSIAE
jgi:hypothetical protein